MTQTASGTATKSKVVKAPKDAKVAPKRWERKPDTPGSESAAPSSSSGPKSLTYEIKALNEKGQYEKAMQVWLEAREKGKEVDEFVYATVLSTYRHLHDYDGAIQLYDEIKKKNIYNAFIENQIVDAYARMKVGSSGGAKKGVTKMYEMLENGLEVKNYAYISIIRGLAQEGLQDDLVGMITQYSQKFEAMDRNFWGNIVNAIFQPASTSTGSIASATKSITATETNAKSKKGAEISKSDSSAHSTSSAVAPNRDACKWLLDHVLEREIALSQPSWLQMLNFFGSQSEKNEDDLVQFNRIVSHLETYGSIGMATLIVYNTERNDAAGALQVWTKLKQTPSFFSPGAFTHLISVCAASGYVDYAEEIFEAMSQAGFEPNDAILAAMVRLHASNLREAEAKHYFDILLSKPSYISPFLFNTMLDMYSELGAVDSASKLVDRMSERKMKFNTSTYNSLLNIYMQSKNLEKAAELYKQMRKDDMPLNFASFKPLLTAPKSPISRTQLMKDIEASKYISSAAKALLKKMAPAEL